MKTNEDQIDEDGFLRVTIGVITRGGPVTINVNQSTDPVLLQGMKLPAEATYEFQDPTDYTGKYVNHPVSIELFFGENGRQGDDISLGEFQLDNLPPAFAGSRNIEIKLTVSTGQILSIAQMDHTIHRFCIIGFIDIAKLEPPEFKTTIKNNLSSQIDLDVFSDIFLNSKPQKIEIPQRGKDILQDLSISFGEALLGTCKEINVNSTETCPVCIGSGLSPGKTPQPCATCQGTGWKKEVSGTKDDPKYWFAKTCPTCKGNGIFIADPCRNCGGNGWVKTVTSITFQVPACIDQDTEIIMLHQGEPGKYKGPPGHLRVKINVTAHPLFTRSGRNIYICMPISIKFAREGGSLRIPDIKKGKSFLVNLPSGTKNDERFPVFESDEFSLTARIETYHPAFLFTQPPVKQRLLMIKEWLGNAEYELPGLLKNVDSNIHQAMASSKKGGEKAINYAEFYTRRGVVFMNNKKMKRALADFNKALDLDPNYSSALNNRGVIYQIQNDLVKAFADFTTALELDPTDDTAYNNRGYVFYLQNNLEMAMNDLNKAIDLNPNKADYFFKRGNLFEYQNEFTKALSDYNKALELDPNNNEYYNRRGILHRSQNNLVEALSDFNKVLGSDSDNYPVLSNHCEILFIQKDFENALIDLNKLLILKPENAMAYNNRGYVYLQKNDLDKALVDYNKALELNPNLIPSYNYRGKIYLNQSNYIQAIDDLRKSLSLNPGDAYVLLWLAQAYQGLGKNYDAVSTYQKILEVSQHAELRQEATKHLVNLGGMKIG